MPSEKFMVHMPTMVVQCNDSNCPVGSTMVGWPHLMTDGCMYAATTHAAVEQERERICVRLENRHQQPCWCNVCLILCRNCRRYPQE